MLDWLLGRQMWIEKSLARRHLEGRTLLLYDVSSSFLEGRASPLAAFGHNRDGKKGKPQIVFGLLCAWDGCPLAVDVFPGNTADPTTVATQVKKIQGRFGIQSIALVGDRGMLTTARLKNDLSPAGLAWISALGWDPQVAAAVKIERRQGGAGSVAAGRFGSRPCRGDPESGLSRRTPAGLSQSPLAAGAGPQARGTAAGYGEDPADHCRRRALPEIPAARPAGDQPPGGAGRLPQEGEKYFVIEVTDDDIRWSRRQEKIDAEAQLDGIYVIRTSLEASALSAGEAVEAYKSLSQVEQAFRSLKTTQLALRPVYVYSEDHVRGHVFLCVLRYYLEWHLRRRLAPLLFQEEDRAGARALRKSPVEKA